MAAKFPSKPTSPTIGIIIPSDQKPFLSIKKKEKSNVALV